MMRIVLKPGCVFLLFGVMLCLIAVIRRPGAATNASSPSPVASTATASTVAAAKPVVAPDGTVRLLAPSADLHGTALQIEHKADQPNIGYWSDPAAWVSWAVPKLPSRRYHVTMQYAAESASAFHLQMDGSTTAASVRPTGDFARFQSADLGVISVQPAGGHVFCIRPKDAATWHPLNVQAVVLTPAKP